MQNQNNTTRFALIRHAQTVWNREKKIQGHSDSPLTADGEKQASSWGRRLSQFAWDRILASDAGRAQATAEIINAILKVPLTLDPRLKEQNWGQWAGLTVRQIESEAQQVIDDKVNAGWDFCPPGGESRRSVWQRSQATLAEAAERYPGQNLLVVTHEGIVKCLIYYLCGRRFLPGEPAILKSYQLHWLVYGHGGLRIERINALELGP
jgi:probable phosphoglycerate mutase